MTDTHITSVKLHQNLGLMIDKALVSPVIVTKHNRDHVVIVSAEHFSAMKKVIRRARLTSSLSREERAQLATGKVPGKKEQKKILAQIAASIESDQ